MTATTSDRQAGVYPAALLAIATHIHEHHLPAPREISRSTYGPVGIEIHVDPGHFDTWANTVIVDHEHNEYRAPNDVIPEPRFRCRWAVRLPDTGTRVTLVGHRTVPLALVEEQAR